MYPSRGAMEVIRGMQSWARRWPTVVLGAGLLLLALAPATAVAQEAADGAAEAPEDARRLFDEGHELAQQERWGEALALFRSAYALAPRSSTAFNIAAVLFRLGKMREALTLLDEYIRDPEIREDSARLEEARELRSQVETSLAVLTLDLLPSDVQVRIDGEVVAGAAVASDPAGGLGTADGRWRALLDPGVHLVSVTREGYVAHETRIRLSAGEVSDQTIHLDAEQSVSLLERPLFWVVVGTVLVGAGVGVAAAAGAFEEDAGYAGSSGIVVESLRVRAF